MVSNEQLSRIWNNCVTSVGDPAQVAPLPYPPTESQVKTLLSREVTLEDCKFTCAEAYTNRAQELKNSYRAPEAIQMYIDLRALRLEERISNTGLAPLLDETLPETIALFDDYHAAQSLLNNLFYNYNGLPLEDESLIEATIAVAKKRRYDHHTALTIIIHTLLHYGSSQFQETLLNELLKNLTSFCNSVKNSFFKFSLGQLETGSPKEVQMLFECLSTLFKDGEDFSNSKSAQILKGLALSLSSPLTANTAKTFCEENSEAINQLIIKLQVQPYRKINPDVKAYLQALHGHKADIQSILQKLFPQTPQ